MSIAFRAAASHVFNGTTGSLTIPTSVAAGDGMLLQVAWNNGSGNAFTTPSGWTQVGTDQTVAARTTRLLKRVASSSDPGTSISFAFTVSAKSVVTLVAYSGTSANIVDTFAVTNDGSSGTSHNAPSLTPGGSDPWLVCLWSEKSSTETGWTAPAGMTQRVVQLGSAGGALSGLVADSNGIVTGPTGTKTATTATATQATGWAVTLELSLSAGPGTASPIAYRAGTSKVANSSTTNVTIPAAVQRYDALLMEVSWNNGGTTPPNTLTTPTGWTQVGSDVTAGTRTSRLLVRQAGTADAGSTVTLNWTGTGKSVITLVAYSGVADTIVDQQGQTTDVGATNTTHTAPSLTGIAAGAWLVCFWAEKSSTNTSWTPPVALTQRLNQLGTSTGALSSLVADSNGSVAAPTDTETATTGNPTQATSWVVTLRPFFGTRSTGNMTLSIALSSRGKKVGKGASATTVATTVDRRMIPRTGVLYGAYANQQGSSAMTMATVANYESLAQRKLQVVRYYKVGDIHTTWFGSGSLEKQLVDAGYLLVFSSKFGSLTWAQVAAGAADSLLVQRAHEIAALNKAMYLSFHHEPEGEQSAADYKAMWRHVHNVMAPLMPKVSWMLIYSGYRLNTQFWIDSYPGDAYVDWLASDPYALDQLNHGVPNTIAQTQQQFRTWYETSGQVGSSVPIAICETGCHDSGANTTDGTASSSPGKAQWYLDNLAWLKAYPRVKMYLEWNDRGTPDSLWVDSSTTALAGFRQFSADQWMTGDVSAATSSGPLTAKFLLVGSGTATPGAPVAPIVSGPTGPSSDTAVTWTFTSTAGTTECQLLKDGTVVSSWASCSSPVTKNLTQGDGLYQLQVRVTDSSQLTSAAGTSQAYALNSIAPSGGGGGTTGGDTGGGQTPPPVITLPGTQYLFKPPTVQEGPAGGGPLFSRYKLTRGVTVLKVGVTYVQRRYPSEGELTTADVVYRGGHEYLLDNTEANALNDAGYGAYLTEIT